MFLVQLFGLLGLPHLLGEDLGELVVDLLVHVDKDARLLGVVLEDLEEVLLVLLEVDVYLALLVVGVLGFIIVLVLAVLLILPFLRFFIVVASQISSPALRALEALADLLACFLDWFTFVREII